MGETRRLRIKTVTGLEFEFLGDVTYKDGVYYCNDESFPESIVVDVVEVEKIA